MAEMSLTQLPITLIVAATVKNGIGKNNGLPWPMLKKDMAFFARVTKRTPIPNNAGSAQSDSPKDSKRSGTSRNVVIMGRKTWESIPPNRRPLSHRTNIVISSQDRAQLGTIPDDVLVASDILSGLASLESCIKDGKVPPVGRVFVIGGSSIYRSSLHLSQTNRILLTRIGKEYECDTFFPVALGDCQPVESSWRCAPRAKLVEFVGEEVEEGPQAQTVAGEEVTLDFQLYER